MSPKVKSFAERVGSTFLFAAVGTLTAANVAGLTGTKEWAAVGLAAVVAGAQSVVKFVAAQLAADVPAADAPAVVDVEKLADAAVAKVAARLDAK